MLLGLSLVGQQLVRADGYMVYGGLMGFICGAQSMRLLSVGAAIIKQHQVSGQVCCTQNM